MEICFSTNATINNFLVWSVRMMKGPVSTITKTLDKDEALNDVVIKGRNLDNKGVYNRFFSSVRANKESGDNLGEELLGICLHILSQLPGERTLQQQTALWEESRMWAGVHRSTTSSDPGGTDYGNKYI